MADAPQGEAWKPLTRDRCISMLNNFADGTYQAISREVCASAAKFLQNSTSNEEAILRPDGGDGGSAI